jgi:hypothetical protein
MMLVLLVLVLLLVLLVVVVLLLLVELPLHGSKRESGFQTTWLIAQLLGVVKTPFTVSGRQNACKTSNPCISL